MDLRSRYRLDYDQTVVQRLYALGSAGAPVRQAVKDLATNPRPDTVRVIDASKGAYELFILGLWIMYSVNEDVRVIKIVSIEQSE